MVAVFGRYLCIEIIIVSLTVFEHCVNAPWLQAGPIMASAALDESAAVQAGNASNSASDAEAAPSQPGSSARAAAAHDQESSGLPEGTPSSTFMTGGES